MKKNTIIKNAIVATTTIILLTGGVYSMQVNAKDTMEIAQYNNDLSNFTFTADSSIRGKGVISVEAIKEYVANTTVDGVKEKSEFIGFEGTIHENAVKNGIDPAFFAVMLNFESANGRGAYVRKLNNPLSIRENATDMRPINYPSLEVGIESAAVHIKTWFDKYYIDTFQDLVDYMYDSFDEAEKKEYLDHYLKVANELVEIEKEVRKNKQ
ncbi:hypothetical protein bcgnr5390_11080 [Bacillus luti]|nr:hypothetical protein BC2903_29830 [Bacillus cereus]